jgi:AraC-like DNA-binding protein
MLYVEESRLPALLGRKRLPRGFRQLNPADDGRVAASPAALADDFLGNDALGLESRLVALLQLVFTRHGGLPELAAARRDNQVVAALRDYLDAHYHESISLQALAAELQRHPRHLIEAFRRQYGVPPHTWQLQRRVREAKRRLLDGQPLAGVALDLGFYDQAHFSATFRRFTGVSPGRFRLAART